MDLTALHSSTRAQHQQTNSAACTDLLWRNLELHLHRVETQELASSGASLKGFKTALGNGAATQVTHGKPDLGSVRTAPATLLRADPREEHQHETSWGHLRDRQAHPWYIPIPKKRSTYFANTSVMVAP